MFKVIEFAFTGYSVTDIARARSFYDETLKLTPASSPSPTEASDRFRALPLT